MGQYFNASLPIYAVCCMNLNVSTFKQTYAVLDWQNKEQPPIKAPENELFTVKYSEVRFDGAM